MDFPRIPANKNKKEYLRRRDIGNLVRKVMERKGLLLKVLEVLKVALWGEHKYYYLKWNLILIWNVLRGIGKHLVNGSPVNLSWQLHMGL